MKRRSVRAMTESAPARLLAETIEQAVELLHGTEFAVDTAPVDAIDEGTLLEQCISLCEQQPGGSPEPIRTVHQFACTGGTLICKCIAAMPNVQLLSELDPLSTHSFDPRKPRFAPTDMIMQMRQSTRGTREQLLIELFRAELRLVYEEACLHGYRLVLRDHAHSHFCRGTEVPERPAFRSLIPPDVPTLSLVIVRDPIDSYASLVENRWLHFEPADFHEYCRRYHTFLDHYAGVPILRYEDFIADPDAMMVETCERLQLPYEPGFQDLFDTFRLTGESGRRGNRIGSRPRRAAAHTLSADDAAAPQLTDLMARMGYRASAS